MHAPIHPDARDGVDRPRGRRHRTARHDEAHRLPGVNVRTVTGPTDRVVVVGAGLGGLACALHLAAAGRQVTVVEREPVPGGRAGRLAVDGYEFDTGPTVLTMPELIAEPLAAVGENLADWLDLTPLDPAYRAFYPDGSTLDVTPTRSGWPPRSPGCAGRARPTAICASSTTPADCGDWNGDHFIEPQPRHPDRPGQSQPAEAARDGRLRPAADQDQPVLRAIPVPGGSSPSRRCTRAWRRTTRWPSTR